MQYSRHNKTPVPTPVADTLGCNEGRGGEGSRVEARTKGQKRQSRYGLLLSTAVPRPWCSLSGSTQARSFLRGTSHCSVCAYMGKKSREGHSWGGMGWRGTSRVVGKEGQVVNPTRPPLPFLTPPPSPCTAMPTQESAEARPSCGKVKQKSHNGLKPASPLGPLWTWKGALLHAGC